MSRDGGVVRVPSAAWPTSAGVVVPVALAVTTGVLALESGGYFPRAWIWSSVVLFWLAALSLVLGPRVAVDRRAVVFVGALALFAGWALASSAWSVDPTQSLLDARRDVVYLATAFAAAAGLGTAGARRLPAATLGAVAVVTALGLGRYLVQGPVDISEGGLLSWPVGYANAFAALAAMSLPVALALAAHCDAAAVRAAAAAALAPLVAVLVVTSSRGGDVAAVAGFLALALFDSRRPVLARVALRLALPCLLVVAVCVWADLPVAAVGGAAGMRRSAVAAAVIVAAASAALVALVPVRLSAGRELSRASFRLIAVVSLLIGGVVMALPELGAASALGRVLGAERAGYWHVAWRVVDTHPFLGSGAGSFGLAWLEHGPAVLGGALDAHQLYLETVAELGPVGLVLLLTALGVPLAAARTAAAASRVGAAAVAAYVAFLVHAFVDWDWEMPAVTVPALALGAAVVVLAQQPAARRRVERRGRPTLAVAAVLLAALSLLGLRSDAVPAAAGATRATAAAVR